MAPIHALQGSSQTSLEERIGVPNAHSDFRGMLRRYRRRVAAGAFSLLLAAGTAGLSRADDCAPELLTAMPYCGPQAKEKYLEIFTDQPTLVRLDSEMPLPDDPVREFPVIGYHRVTFPSTAPIYLSSGTSDDNQPRSDVTIAISGESLIDPDVKLPVCATWRVTDVTLSSTVGCTGCVPEEMNSADAAFKVLPAEQGGYEFRIIALPGWGDIPTLASVQRSYSMLEIMCYDDNSIVTVERPEGTEVHRMNKGDALQLNEDAPGDRTSTTLTNTRVYSTGRITMLGGATYTRYGETPDICCSDPAITEQLPVERWGRTFIASPQPCPVSPPVGDDGGYRILVLSNSPGEITETWWHGADTTAPQTTTLTAGQLAVLRAPDPRWWGRFESTVPVAVVTLSEAASENVYRVGDLAIDWLDPLESLDEGTEVFIPPADREAYPLLNDTYLICRGGVRFYDAAGNRVPEPAEMVWQDAPPYRLGQFPTPSEMLRVEADRGIMGRFVSLTTGHPPEAAGGISGSLPRQRCAQPPSSDELWDKLRVSKNADSRSATSVILRVTDLPPSGECDEYRVWRDTDPRCLSCGPWFESRPAYVPVSDGIRHSENLVFYEVRKEAN